MGNIMMKQGISERKTTYKNKRNIRMRRLKKSKLYKMK